ncbi:MAG: DNA primase catalytic subunit PriS [Candidatus Methanofastidiosia archaeon]
MHLREATPHERKLFYKKEWRAEDIPEFILDSLSKREFAFDLDGLGPRGRYYAFSNLKELEKFVRKNFPYAIYTSVSYYKKPEKREGYEKAELVFDIDAKDLPVKRCNCQPGSVCEICLEDAKELALIVSKTLELDFGFNNIFLVYSGRGYHLRVFDEEVMKFKERGAIFDYVSASLIPRDLFMQKGYPRVFRKMFDFTFKRVSKLKVPGILKRREKILKALNSRNKIEFDEILTEKRREFLLSEISKLNSQLLDGKVTVDVKRILRLPTSLHSKVSLKCLLVRNPEKFDPFSEALPEFRSTSQPT